MRPRRLPQNDPPGSPVARLHFDRRLENRHPIVSQGSRRFDRRSGFSKHPQIVFKSFRADRPGIALAPPPRLPGRKNGL